ncbi:MAG: glycosyltransferase family 9 protein, partial [Minisyncoccia bacterium]
LLEIYARREMEKGIEFPADDEAQKIFEDSFIYEETPPGKFEIILNKIILFFFGKTPIKKIRVISYFDKNWPQNIFPSDVYKQSFFISQIIKELKPNVEFNNIGIIKDVNFKTEIFLESILEKDFERKFLENFKLKKGKYCIVGLGSSSEHKNWPVEYFAEVAKYLKEQGYKIVLIGSKESLVKVENFKKYFGNDFVNLIFKTSLEELCLLIKNSKMVVGNDTSFIHIGIAFKIPTVCPILNTYLGVDSLYGYEEINKWVFLQDKEVQPLAKLTPEKVIETINEILMTDNYNDLKFKLFFGKY